MTASALPKILVIDDEEIIRSALHNLLTFRGYQVSLAPGGPEGLELCRQEHPDLILLDINMPLMNGFEICAELKADAKLKDIPVIFLSGLLALEDKVKAFKAGGVDYITKPFQFEEVDARIRTHLELRRQKREIQESHEAASKALVDEETMNRKLIEVNEKLRASEALKSQFIANMRNEINNPLNGIMGLAEGIAEGHVPPEQARLMARLIRAEAFNLDTQLHNVFCAAELEAGVAAPVITNVDINSVLRNTVESFAHLARAKSVCVSVEIEPEGEPLLFNTDADKLRIIASNLLANAIEFNREDGHVWVHASLQDDNLVLAVRDEGIGIAAADLPLIFEEFRQLDTGVTRAHGGEGLGLSVVKALLELLDGWITVESEPEQGSTFTCFLPCHPTTTGSGITAFDGNLFFFEDAEEA